MITSPRFPTRLELEIMEARCMALEGRLEDVEVALDKYCGRGFSSEHALNDTPLVQISQVMVRVIEFLHRRLPTIGPFHAGRLLSNTIGRNPRLFIRGPAVLLLRAFGIP